MMTTTETMVSMATIMMLVMKMRLRLMMVMLKNAEQECKEAGDGDVQHDADDDVAKIILTRVLLLMTLLMATNR